MSPTASKTRHVVLRTAVMGIGKRKGGSVSAGQSAAGGGRRGRLAFPFGLKRADSVSSWLSRAKHGSSVTFLPFVDSQRDTCVTRIPPRNICAAFFFFGSVFHVRDPRRHANFREHVTHLPARRNSFDLCPHGQLFYSKEFEGNPKAALWYVFARLLIQSYRTKKWKLFAG